MKFELTSETITKFGVKLHRIRALITFGSVKAGDAGGFMERAENLSQDGNAWVSGDARVSGDAQVYGNAQVSGNAWVSGDARVSGDAQVSGNAQVYGNAWVSGDAQVYGNAQVSPIVISGLTYPVTITDKHMQIGCEFHLLSEWQVFDDERIARMDGCSSRRFWKAWKEPLLAIARAGERDFTPATEKQAA